VTEYHSFNSHVALGVTENHSFNSHMALGVTENHSFNSHMALGVTENHSFNSHIALGVTENASAQIYIYSAVGSLEPMVKLWCSSRPVVVAKVMEWDGREEEEGMGRKGDDTGGRFSSLTFGVMDASELESVFLVYIH